MARRASVTACSRFAQALGSLRREDGEQAVADEFQDLAAVPRDRLRHRVEIVVEQIDDVVARPVVGDFRELAQIADHDRGAYRRAGAAPGGAGQDELASVGADIGLEQRPRQAVLDADFADQRQHRQYVLECGDMRGVEAAGPVGREGDEMALAERVIERPGHVFGQAFRAHLVVEGVLAAERGVAFEISRVPRLRRRTFRWRDCR
ncbi:hypothetical protein ACVWW5_006704 [Bradyrhizobium sp. LM3.4]